MKIYYATTNEAKLLSLRRELEKYNKNYSFIIEQTNLILPESRSSDVEVMAAEKVNYAHDKINRPVVALDTGFYIPSLNGFPRASAKFVLETIGVEGILKLVEGKDRKCELRNCLAYKDSSLIGQMLFTSSLEGKLTDSVRGEMQPHLWSELSLIFIPQWNNKTLAEMSHKEYLAWSASLIGKKESSMFADWIVREYGQVY